MATWKPDGEVEPGGDGIGGDIQAGQAWSVRYHNTDDRDADEHAVVTVYYYAVSQPTGEYGIECQEELTLCTDPFRPGDTEIWADARYTHEPDTYTDLADATKAARRFAERHRGTNVAWEGTIR